MMTKHVVVAAAALFVAAGMSFAKAGQHDVHQTPDSGMQGATEAAQCAQAQDTVARTIEAAMMRLEAARQSNSATAMRDAVDDLQAALLDIRTSLAPCRAMQAAAPDPHAGHAMPMNPGR